MSLQSPLLLSGHGWLFLHLVCVSAMFDGLVMWLTFNCELAWERKALLLEGSVEDRAKERDKTCPCKKHRSGTDHTFSLFRNHPRCICSFFGKCSFISVICLVACARAAVCSCQAQEDFVSMWDKQWSKNKNSDRNGCEQSYDPRGQPCGLLASWNYGSTE